MPNRILRYVPRSIRDRLIRARMFADESALDGLEVKVADTSPEIERAAGLLHDAYVGRGLVASHSSRLRVTPHLVLPSTVTLVARNGTEIVGCLSLFGDSTLGLPMEEVFAAEVATLRDQSRRLIELGALAITPAYWRTGLAFLLYKLAYHVSHDLQGADDFVFAVHPDAESVYRATLLCERMGAVRRYPGLNRAALAVMLRLDLRRFRERLQTAFGRRPRRNDNPYHLYFGRAFAQLRIPSDSGFVERIRIPRLQAAARLLAARPDALDKLEPHQLAALRRAVPNLRTIPRMQTNQGNAEVQREIRRARTEPGGLG